MLVQSKSGSPRAAASSSDLLTAFLGPLRIECRQLQPWRLRAPWGLQFANAGLGFLVVTEGQCHLQTEAGSPSTLLQRHDLAIFSARSDFQIFDEPGRPCLPVQRQPSNAFAVHETLQPGGAGPETRLLWGMLGNEDDYTRQALSLLPPLIVTRHDDAKATDLPALLQLLVGECEVARPGSQLLVNRYLHALFVHALRLAPPNVPESHGLLSALAVPGLGSALGAMHARPDHDWSVQELAKAAGLSRSRFALLFMESLGCPPFAYLRDLRMGLACQLLKETDRGVKEIAQRVGYATETSFSKALVRWCGSTPREYRRHETGAPRTADAES